MKLIKLDQDNPLSQNELKLYRLEADKLDPKFINQIIEKSRQPHVMEFEADEDAGGRFKNIESYKSWAKKRRVIYLLINQKNDDLAGIIWFGKRQNLNIDKKYSITFGVRLYEGYLGRGLSKPLMKVSHLDVKNVFDDQYIWLDYDKDNFIAGKAYKSFGYEDLGQADGRIIMGRKL